jgi:hypothetical protein
MAKAIVEPSQIFTTPAHSMDRSRRARTTAETKATSRPKGQEARMGSIADEVNAHLMVVRVELAAVERILRMAIGANKGELRLVADLLDTTNTLEAEMTEKGNEQQ